MIFRPKVSIVIPVFNGSDYLAEAVKSALSQTYKNTEVIIVNDGSNDNGATERVALSFGSKVKYFWKENGGVATALNFAIQKMTGDYFSWLSHDDLYFCNKVETQVKALTQIHDKNVVLYSDFGVFNENPEKLSEVKLPNTPPENFRYFITVMNSLHGCSLLIPRDAFKDCGVFNEGLRTTQDFDLWFRMAQKYNFIHLPHVLVKARSHAEQGSIKMKATAIAECNELLIGFVDKLSETELTSATKKSLSRSYAEISASLERRGFILAASYTANLAVKSLNRASFLDALESFCILAKVKLINGRMGRFRSMCSNLRCKVKKCLN